MRARLGRFFGSLKLTVVLLAAMVGLFLVGLAVPQRSVLPADMYRAWRDGSPNVVAALEWLQLTAVYTSWIALLLWALFFVNLLVVFGKRSPGILARALLRGPIPEPGDVQAWPRKARVEGAPDDALQRAGSYFAARGYWVRAEGARVLAVRNRWSPIATLVFHASFIILLVGGVTSVFTRFQATVRLAEGERFTGALQQYESRPSMPRWGDIPYEPFLVERIVPTVEGNTPTGLRAEIVDEHGAVHTAEINRPFRTGNRDFVIRDLGIAALVLVRGADGRELDGAWVKLDVLMGKRDRFDLAGLSFGADYYPDHVVLDGEDASATQEFRNPVLRLEAKPSSGPAIRLRMRKGDEGKVGDHVIIFADQRFWLRMLVRKESGIPVLWAGLALACAALLFRLGLYRRDYLMALEGRGGEAALTVVARAEFYRSLFEEEFDATVSALRASLDGGAQPRGSAPTSDGAQRRGMQG